MSIFDDIESGFIDFGNAVTGTANTIADNVSSTATSFTESIADYAIIVGDGVASAGNTIGDGVVTFGNDVAQFSVSTSGTAFNWMRTSAYDVGDWVENAAGIVANFSVDAFNKARDGLVMVWNLIKDLLSSTLPELDAPSSIADQIALFLLGIAKLGYEEFAKAAGMTIGFTITPKAGALFNISYTLGLYVDDDGKWGFVKLVSWDQFKNLSTASISLSAGISLTVENIYVFGSRSAFSGRKYFDLGGQAKFGAYSAGGSVMLDADNLDFVGFKLAGSIGLDLTPKPTNNTEPPTTTFNLNGQALNVPTLLEAVGGAGTVYDAAVSSLQDPGTRDRIINTALAATMLPFTPRFYGQITSMSFPEKPWRFGPYASVTIDNGSVMSLDAKAFRLVAGLADPKGVSIQCYWSDDAAYYVQTNSDNICLIQPPYPYNAVYGATETFNLEQGLADKTGVSFSTRTTPKRYLVMSEENYSGLGCPILLARVNDGSDRFARQATFYLNPQSMPAQETAVVRSGETIAVGEYRRSPDGRYYMVRQDNQLVLGCGPSPSFPRPAPAFGSPGTGYVSQITETLAGTSNLIFGNPGPLFIAVTDGGRIIAMQGSPQSPGEALQTSTDGTIRWATSRSSVAIKANNGRLVRVVPGLPNGQGRLAATGNGVGSYETFELLTHYDGTYSLRSALGWFVWADNGAVANLPTSNEGTAFRMEAQSNGQVVLKSATSNKLMVVTSNGSILDTTGIAGQANTLFTILPIERNFAAEVGRAFAIKNKGSGRYVTVSSCSQAANAPIHQQGMTGGRNQSFTLVSMGADVYAFAAQHSGKVFDFASTAPNTPLVQYNQAGSAGQKYRLLPNNDTTFHIIAELTGLALTVSGGSLADGAALIFTALDVNSSAQRFYLEPQTSLVTRALIADPVKNQPPMRTRYLERAGQSTWLEGWLDATDRQFVGDFLGLGRAQLLCLNRSGVGGRAMIADFGKTGDAGTGRALYYETFGESAWLNGWTDDGDWQLVGDFKGLRRKQLMVINRSGSAGRNMILQFLPHGYRMHYFEAWGANALFNGWQDGVDKWLVGDFMGKGYDQVLCINRNVGGGKVMIVDFSGSTPAVLYWENWGQYAWLDATKFLADSSRHFVGDFFGRGYDQFMALEPSTRAVRICDFKSGTPTILNDGAYWWLGGWVDGDDAQVVGDFLGLGRAQLLCSNRQPWNNGKIAIFDFLLNTYPYVEEWSHRTCFDGLLDPQDLVFAGDFMGDGRKQSQVLVLNTTIKGAAHPSFVSQPGPNAIGEGLGVRVRFSNGVEQVVPLGAAAYSGGATISGFTLELSPPIPGVGIEYTTTIIGSGATAWTPGGTYCGTTAAGGAIQGFAVRLTGAYRDAYIIEYSGNGALAAFGDYAGNTTGTALTSLRIAPLRVAQIARLSGIAGVGPYTSSPPQTAITVSSAPSVMPLGGIVLATAQGGPYPDTFAVTSRQVATNSFRVNVRRRDNVTVGWGQDLKLSWIACNIVNQPHFKCDSAPVGSQLSGYRKVVNVAFPAAFARVPKVIAMARGLEYVDTFSVTIRSVTTTGFKVSVNRVDQSTGWGQDLKLDYIAWDDEDGLRVLGAKQVCSGTADIGAQAGRNYARVKVGFTMPKDFATTPAVIMTPLAADVDEDFDATATEVNTSTFVANLARSDAQAGWTQALRVTYLALL